jgi:prolyl-tRNA synthetase
MRQRHALIPTLREAPAEAEVLSHKMMLRGGYIRQLAAGIYTYLPLGRRVLRKLETIIREEMELAGAQEILMPALQPTELWQESGRYGIYGPELIRLRDRNHREFALGPTHEEVVTTLIRDEVSSYRKLPLLVYQIQTKFRDERRPRFGLLRGREFLMKDAYSFDADWEGLDLAYQSMYRVYQRIFSRCGLRFLTVEADGGSIGGEGATHEFMALTEIGEDTVVTCSGCDYAANLEMASSGPDLTAEQSPAEACQAHTVERSPTVGQTLGAEHFAAAKQAPVFEQSATAAEREPFETPDITTIDQLIHSLDVSAEQLMKTLIYKVDGKPVVVAVVVRGDHEVNEAKVKQYLQADQLELADAETVTNTVGVSIGFIGPVGLPVRLLVDREAAALPAGIAGANKMGYHLRNVRPGRDFDLTDVGDFRNALEGDPCPHCEEGKLRFSRGIEVGHIFKLGTKYSKPLGAGFLDQNGRQQPMLMGCYGIGISRLLSAIAEQCLDNNGIVWPSAIAPFQVHLIPMSVQDRIQMDTAEELYERLSRLGVEVLLDDREERPGVKLKDADLFGIPLRFVIGKKAQDGYVEVKARDSAEVSLLTVQEALERAAAAQ